jgi:hypothetical protein
MMMKIGKIQMITTSILITEIIMILMMTQITTIIEEAVVETITMATTLQEIEVEFEVAAIILEDS